MQHNVMDAVWRWFHHIRDRVPGYVIRLVKCVRQWRSVALVVALVSALTAAACVPVSAAPVTATPEPKKVAEIVLCIGVVRDNAGRQYAFFQRGGDSIEKTLTEQGMAELVRDDFTVEHRNCYHNWQAAADFLTDGAVTLPANATEQDFAKALLEWKRQQLESLR